MLFSLCLVIPTDRYRSLYYCPSEICLDAWCWSKEPTVLGSTKWYKKWVAGPGSLCNTSLPSLKPQRKPWFLHISAAAWPGSSSWGVAPPPRSASTTHEANISSIITVLLRHYNCTVLKTNWISTHKNRIARMPRYMSGFCAQKQTYTDCIHPLYP